MLGITMERATLEALCADVGVEDVRFNYSGRGMFGRTCFGFVGRWSDVAVFFYRLGLATDDEDGDDGTGELLASDLRTDDMGLSTIFYFPGLEVSDPGDDAEDEELDPDDPGDPDAERDRTLERDLR